MHSASGPGDHARQASSATVRKPCLDWANRDTEFVILEEVFKEFYDFHVWFAEYLEAEGCAREGLKDARGEQPVLWLPVTPLADIARSWGNPRESGDERGEPHVQGLMDAMRAGRRLPPAVVCLADGAWLLMDGRHRVLAAERLGVSHVPCIDFDAVKALAGGAAASLDLVKADLASEGCSPVDLLDGAGGIVP